MNILNFTKSAKQEISEFKDPFTKSSVKNIMFRTYTSSFHNKTIWIGNVDFQNGQTSGSQEFEKDTFQEIVLAVDNFVNTLN
jgi:hypothetical protein